MNRNHQIKNQNKYLITLLLSLLVLINTTSCKQKKVDLSDKINIVCTIFPEYDWVQQIIGKESQNTLLTLVIKNGTDLHSFQPSATDIVNISTSDLFIYVGGESDEWIEDVLKNNTNKEIEVINLMEVLSENIKEEMIIEGMENHEHEEDEEEIHEGDIELRKDSEHRHSEIEYDEHVWLSIKNTMLIVKAISEKLISIDPENAQIYKNNTAAYLQKLEQLDKNYEETLASLPFNTLIFCDRFPFRYLTDDYNLKYYAAFPGCSAETEASFETVAFLSEKLQDSGINAVCIIENSTDKLARTVIHSAEKKNCNIITLNSMQSTTLKQIFDGENYIKIMEKNLENLSKALK